MNQPENFMTTKQEQHETPGATAEDRAPIKEDN
jgi:hypothetical protein